MKRENGVISLITSIMVSILVITMAMGLLILTTGGTQQASDDELSMRAYAAANGAVEWAYWDALYGSHSNINSCTGSPLVTNLNAPYTGTQNAVTCVKVTTSSNALTGYLHANEAQQIVIDNTVVPPLRDIEVSWLNHDLGDVPYPVGGYSTYVPGGSFTQNLPKSRANGSDDLPALELTIVNYNQNGAGINPVGITIRNVILLPNDTAGNNCLAANTRCGSPLAMPSKVAVHCANGGGYQCINTVGGMDGVPASNTNFAGLSPANQGAIIYVRVLYPDQYPGANGTHFQLRFLDTAGNPIALPSFSATIDVTARSGPVYRRIQATATPGSGTVPAGLNYVLFGDNQICKDFSIASSASVVNPIDPNTCNVP